LYPLQGQFEFDARRRQAFWKALRSVLTGRARTLLSLDDVLRAAGKEGQVDRGIRRIPLAQVRGSEGRSNEFDAAFLPVNPRLKERWARLDNLMQQGMEMPPIEVYELGGLYFVKDGHHRVSVARHLGQETIRANVIEVTTRAPLPPDVDAAHLIRTAEYADFLQRTQLDKLRPEARLACRDLGRYDLILDHILGHRYFMSQDRGHEVSLPEAAASWYDEVFIPVMEVVKQHRIAEHFPGWSEADLYVAVTSRWLEMSKTDESSGPEGAAAALLKEPDPMLAGMTRALRRWRRDRRRHTIRLGLRRNRVNEEPARPAEGD
jgi:hypothetical protein